jgi:hypothetical protein
MADLFLKKVPDLVQNIFTINSNNVVAGEVISFNYSFFKHDPYPVIISTGLTNDGRIGGLNLHYLTFPVFRALLNRWGGNRSFNYTVIKNQFYIKKAFRTYKIYGIINAKKINWRAVIQSLSIIRNYSQQEMLRIRNAVNQQVLNRQPQILNDILGENK